MAAENSYGGLFSTPGGGFQLIGTVTKDVAVMNNNQKSVAFSVNYTFTNDDLAIGKVRFQAVASIQGDHPNMDAFPSDNTKSSTPMTVTS